MAILRLFPLESLPTEILVLVLSAVARSPRDLGSLICTSSTIYTCFKSFKVCILTAPALQDLGPAIIEAIALSCVSPLTFSSSKDPGDLRNETAVQNYIRQYHQLVASSPVPKESSRDGRCLKWITREITPQMAESIMRLNIAVQFFADLYLATRLGYLQNRITLLEQEIKQPASYECAAEAEDSDVKPDVVALASEVTILQALRSSMMSPRVSHPRSIQISMYCETLSALEQKRLYQAFLRVQLLVTLAGINDRKLLGRSSRDTRAFDPQLLFTLGNAQTTNQGNHGHPTGGEQNEGSPSELVVPELVARVMGLYNPWELEQVSQAQYFGFSLMTCVNSAGNWPKTGLVLRSYDNFVELKHRLWRDRYTEITTRSFDLVGFRKRLLKGGAGICLGHEQTGQKSGQGRRGGCLQARGFDSVRVAAPRRDGESSDTGPAARSEEEQNQHQHYEPLIPSPTGRDLRSSYAMRTLDSRFAVLPVSREFHGRDVVHDQHDHVDGMRFFFGPGPGAPQNVHQLECHVALRLMLLKGPGRSNGTCMATESTNIPWLSASHRFERGRGGWPPPGKPDIRPGPAQGSDENNVPDGLAATKKPSLLPEPYAWADALDGLSWDRWGMDFLPLSPEDQEVDYPGGAVGAPLNPRRNDVDYRFARWRYLGLVFWDEARVRDIRTALGDYHTGWLNRVWDE